jgi:L,D-peptidoglycan transpeptidase YkuD (ErfK/YbiS/YcfS/YnhG family)
MDIEVTARPGEPIGELRLGDLHFPCALGCRGLVSEKREGDGGTPIGTFPLLQVHYRADRIVAPATSLPLQKIEPSHGWCDAPDDAAYNQPVTLPYPASAEHMWRNDHLYDLVVILDYNMEPVRPFAGSAIFFHLAKEETGILAPTEGCVALRKRDMLQVLARITQASRMRIG